MHTPLLHCALGPHGDGLHGSLKSGGSKTKISHLHNEIIEEKLF